VKPGIHTASYEAHVACCQSGHVLSLPVCSPRRAYVVLGLLALPALERLGQPAAKRALNKGVGPVGTARFRRSNLEEGARPLGGRRTLLSEGTLK
jgi:hypothetical protein